MIVSKDSILRCNNDITAHGDLKPASHCSTLYTADDRHSRLLHSVEGIDLSHPVFHEVWIVANSVDVDASAERFSIRVQNDDFDLRKINKIIFNVMGYTMICLFRF